MWTVAYRKRLLAGVVAGCGAAALSFDIPALSRLSSIELLGMLQFFGRVLVVPGVLLSIAVSGSAHTFPLWIAAAGNFAVWLCLCWLMGELYSKLEERKRLENWLPMVKAREAPSPVRDNAPMLDAIALTALQERCTRYWHATQDDATTRAGNDWQMAVERQHRANFDLWHIEDKARTPNASDEDVAAVKRRIDTTNQLRNDLAEELDRILLDWLESNGMPNPGAPLNSESPGQIIDRLSILSLRIYHTREEAVRPAAPAGHAERNRERLAVLEEQRNDLSDCLDALWRETLAGTRRFKAYRQMKMYNDPDLNPAIYGK
ncbi:MAG TPA: DUF4254 domain-containing protein [Terracidiphilus sp.]|jgi:hypothetical protein|nr:DUF4254 domain-containing protein [Terracidiphilus sp.]